MDGSTPPPRDERLRKLVHDLSTPLSVVSGFAELIEQRGETIDPAQRAEFLANIAAAAREMRAILDAQR